MRNGKLGALALGLGMTLSVAAPAMAQDLGDEDAFAADFLGGVEQAGISEATEEVLENIGLEEEEGTIVAFDLTPLNPVDVAGSEGEIFIDDVTFPSEVEE